MKVTGQRALGEVKGVEREQPRRAKETKQPWKEDGFDAPVKKPAPKKGSKTPRVQASAGLVKAGASALQRDQAVKRTEPEALRDAGWLLGGLTTSLVMSVLHQFQLQPQKELDPTVQRLGELCGALFVEFVGRMVSDDVLEEANRVARDAQAFSGRFEKSFGMTPLEATGRFIEFIASTEGKPRERLRGSTYATR